MSRRLPPAVSIGLSLVVAVAADDPPKPPPPPVVRTVAPFGVTPGPAPVRVTVRGHGLDTATAARLSPPVAEVTLVAHEKANPPDGLDAARFGDSRVVVTFPLPAGSAREPLGLIVTTPAGDSDLIPIRLDVAAPTPEAEPNGGFAASQPLTLPAVVDGAIEGNQDVDVFRVQGPPGAPIACRLLAARRGSALDPLLSLYGAGGRLLATATPAPGAAPDADLTLSAPLPADGSAWLVLQDANDKGSPLHTYRLHLEPGR